MKKKNLRWLEGKSSVLKKDLVFAGLSGSSVLLKSGDYTLRIGDGKVFERGGGCISP